VADRLDKPRDPPELPTPPSALAGLILDRRMMRAYVEPPTISPVRRSRERGHAI
jgi:hypothetical protein